MRGYSQFPFPIGAKLLVRIEGDQLVITPAGVSNPVKLIREKIMAKKNAFDDLIIVEHDEVAREIALKGAQLLNDVLHLLKNPVDFQSSEG